MSNGPKPEISTYLRFPLAIALWMVYLISGVLSIAREVYGMYSGSVPPRSVFWSSTWIAFAMSTIILWVIEHKKFLEEKSKNDIAPDIEIQVLSVIPKGRSALTDLFVHVILTLNAPSEVLVRGFSMTAQKGTDYMNATAIDDLAQWELVRQGSDGMPFRTTCAPLPKRLTQRGDPVVGWVHYPLKNVRESDIFNSMLWLKVNTAHGTCLIEAKGSLAFPHAKTKGVMRELELARNLAS